MNQSVLSFLWKREGGLFKIGFEVRPHRVSALTTHVRYKLTKNDNNYRERLHSDLKLFTGFMHAALIISLLITARARERITITGIKNIHHLKDTW
jgi:hypothetical protein